MNEELSETIGLSEQESEVYLSLLQLGKSSATNIARLAKINRTTVYYSLEKLIEKGLVSYVNLEGNRYFSAIGPEALPDIIEIQKKDALLKFSKKENLLKGVIPQLKILQNVPREDLKINVIEGRQGIKNYIEKMIKTILDEDIREFVSINDTRPGFLKKYMKFERDNLVRRGAKIFKKRKIDVKWLFLGPEDKRAKDEMSYFMGTRKYFFSKHPVFTNTQIYGNYLDIVLFEEKPIIITIKNRFVADTFKAMFDVIWGMN